MKQNKIRTILAVVLAIISISAWADDRVVIAPTQNGTVTAGSISATGEQTVTLTVTPAANYYIEVSSIIVSKTTNTAQARQNTPGYADRLTVTAVSTDGTGKGTYQFTLPNGYGAYVEATFTHCIAINPVVTITGWTYGATPNAPSVTGNTGNGTVTYTYAVKGTTAFSATVPVNAGQYTVKASIAAAGHYMAGEATADFTISNATMNVTATGYSGVYDGQAHGISVTAPEGAVVKYGTAEGSCMLDASPTYINTGTYTVFYEVTQANYNTVTGNAVVSISKAAGTISYSTTSITKTFGDEPFTNELTITGDGMVSYASSDATVATVDAATGLVTIVGNGTTTITATVDDGTNYTYATKTASYTLGVGTATMAVTALGYEGVYDGEAHGISVTAPEGATVMFGTTEGSCTLDASPTYTDAGSYTVYYEVTKTNFTTVTGSAIVSISKAAGTISYSTTSITKTFGYEPFTNELTITGDGTVSYASSDATVATVDAATGLVTIVGNGTTTITATVDDGTNYTYATKTASYTLGVGTATMAVTALGYEGVYDGEAHGISVTAPEGATVMFGTTEGSCTLDASPTYTDAGSYTVYYEVTKTNFTTVTGSAIVSISKAAGTISYSTTSITKTFGYEPFTNELTITGDGTVSYASSDATVATVDAETGLVTIVGAGTTTITATVADGTNYTYEPQTANYTLTVTDKTTLTAAIAEALVYYESIKEAHADIAAVLKEAIDVAQAVADNAEATQEDIDAALPVLTAALEAAQEAVAAAEQLAANKQAYADYQTAAKAIADALAEDGDSEACLQLIEAAKAAIDSLPYDENKTLDENKAAVDAIIEQLKSDLAAQRQADIIAAELEAAKKELGDAINEANTFYESIKDLYIDIAGVLKEAIDAAQTVLDDADATREDVDTALLALKTALQVAKADAEEASAVGTVTAANSCTEIWYTVDGRRLSCKPTVKGIYVRNGRKVVIK